MSTEDTNKCPHGKSQSTVGIETERHMTTWVEFAGQFEAGAEAAERTMGNNDATQTTTSGYTEVQISCRVNCSIGNSCQFALGIVINIKNWWPTLRINGCSSLSTLEQLYNTLN